MYHGSIAIGTMHSWEYKLVMPWENVYMRKNVEPCWVWENLRVPMQVQPFVNTSWIEELFVSCSYTTTSIKHVGECCCFCRGTFPSHFFKRFTFLPSLMGISAKWCNLSNIVVRKQLFNHSCLHKSIAIGI